MSRAVLSRARFYVVKALFVTLLATLVVPVIAPAISDIASAASARDRVSGDVGFTNPGPNSGDFPIEAGAYIIDSGALSAGATKQTVNQGLKQYGLVYALVKAKIPVQWVINPSKSNMDTTLGNTGTDFSFDCMGTGTAKNYKSGAFIIAKEFAAQAKATIDTWKSTYSGLTVDGPCTNSYTNAATNNTVPVFATIKSWPRSVLDAQNGSVAVTYFNNAGIPQGSTTDVNNPPAYRFAAPSQLTPCDDMYIMPHADPTYATHSGLINFVRQGGDFYASCHAVSVIENMKDSSNQLVTNFLSTNGLVNYDQHSSQGSPAYSLGAAGVPGDPVAQFLGTTDAAMQAGSEQIFIPSKTPGSGSVWRPTTRVLVYDQTQANVPGTITNPNNAAAAIAYGPAFGDLNAGLVMYQGGHSVAKGTADDVAAQRAFFNFQLLAAVNNGQVPSASDRTPTVVMTETATSAASTGATFPVAGYAMGGSGTYRYSWASSCSDSTGPISATGTFGSTSSAATTFTAPNVPGAIKCNLTLTIIDSCGRFSFGFQTIAIAPTANIRISQTVSPTGSVFTGAKLLYTATVTNDGAIAGTSSGDGNYASDVMVTIPVPSGGSYDSTYSPTWTYTGTAPSGASVRFDATSNKLIFTFKTLSDEQSVTFTYKLVPGNVGTFKTVATASTTSFDSDLTDNSATNTNSVTQDTTPRPSLLVEKSPGVQVSGNGGVAAFKLRVKNSSNTNQSIRRITIKDEFTPTSARLSCTDGITGRFWSGVTSGSTYEIPEIKYQEAWEAACELSGMSAGGTNTLSIVSASADSGTVTSNSSSVTINAAGNLTISKTGPALLTKGSTAPYTITVTNKGTAATGVKISDLLPAGLTVDSATVEASSTSGSDSSTATMIAWDKFSADPSGTGWKSASTWTKVGTTFVSSVDSTLANPFKYANYAMKLSGTSSSTSYIARKVQLSTLYRSINIHFACLTDDTRSATANVADRTNIKASIVTPSNETITMGTVNCGTTGLAEQTISANVSALGLTSTLRDYTLVFSLGGMWTGTKSVWLDDVALISSELASDQFTDTTATSWTKTGSTYGTYLKGYGVGSAKFPNSSSTYSDGTFLAWNTGSDLRNTASTTISKTFTFDASQYSSTTAKISFACYVGQNDSNTKLEIFFGSNSSSTYTYNKDNNSSSCGSSNSSQSSASMKVVSVPYPAALITANAVNTLTVKFKFSSKKSSDSIYLDDFFFYAKQLGTVQSSSVVDWNTALNGPGGNGYNLATNGTVKLTFSARVANKIPEAYLLGLVNVASVTSSSQATPTYASVFTPFKSASIAVLKSANKNSVLSGDTVTVTYLVWNPGNDTITGVSVADPDCASIGTKTVLAGNGGADLQPGERWQYTCSFTVTSNKTGVFSASGTNSDSNVESAEDGDDIIVAVASIAVSASPSAKKIYPGSSVVYTYTVRNTGNVSLYKAGITAQNCGNPRFKSGDDNGDGSINPEETWQFICTTAPINESQTAQSVVATSTSVGYETSVNSSPVSVSVTVVQKPVMRISKTVRDSVSNTGPASSITVSDSNTVIYTYSVTSTTAAASSVRVGDNGCSVSATPMSGDTNSNNILDLGETWIFSCTAGKLTVSETSTATSSGVDELGNRIQSEEVSTNVEVAAPDMLLTVNPNKDYVLLGETVTYTYKIKNVGGAAFTAITPTDTNCAISSTLGGSLQPGDTWTFTCSKTADTATMLSEFNATGTYSTSLTYRAAQANYQVFVMDPRMTIQKLAQVYVGNTNETRTAFSSSVRAGRGDKIVFKYLVSPNEGPKAAPIPGLNAIVLNAISDNDCDVATFISTKNNDGFNIGDSNGSGAMDKGEVWEYTCTAKASVTSSSRADNEVVLSPAQMDAVPAIDATSAGPGASLMQSGVVRRVITASSVVRVQLQASPQSSKKFTIRQAASEQSVRGANLTDSSSATVIIDPAYVNHFIFYNANGGSGTPPSSQAGTGAMTLADQGSLTRSGYTFAGWSETATTGANSARAPGSSFTLGLVDVTMYAIWYAQITYDGNGNDAGSVPTDSTKYLPSGTVTIASGSGISKSGANFSNWNTKADGSGQSFAAGATPTMESSLTASTLPGDSTLYAQWSTTLSYNGNTSNSGSAPAALATYPIGTGVTVLDNTGNYVKTSNTFVGWNTAADGSGNDYYAGDIVTLDTFTVLYAQWTTNPTYRITYTSGSATSGTVPVDNRNYQSGDQATVLSNSGNLVKTGYIFHDWTCSSVDVAVGAQLTIGSTNIVCVAHWIANKYTVTYDLNGGSGTVPTEIDHVLGETFTVASSMGFSKTGATFLKWNDGANDYLPGATYTIGTSSVVLTAQWSNSSGTPPGGNGGSSVTQSYKITFNSNSPSPATATQSGSGSVNLNPNTFNRNGYTFKGWSTSPSGAVQYKDKDLINLTGDLTLYAIWEENVTPTPNPPAGNGPFTVFFNSNTPAPIIEKQINQGNVKLNSNTFTRTGFVFLGWSTSPTGGVEYKDQALFNFNKNVTLYAVWQASATPAPAITSGSLRFEVFFGMNSVIITDREKKNIQNQVAIIKRKAGSNAKISVVVEGWVQPNPKPGNIEFLAKWRAKHVADYMKKLGLKATYKELYKGLGKDNIPKARHASVFVDWSK